MEVQKKEMLLAIKLRDNHTWLAYKLIRKVLLSLQQM